jgi:hypothetical protein
MGPIVPLAICAGLWGCDSSKEENIRQGELGNGTFEYLCASPSDAQCDEGEVISEAAFSAIVVGGGFGLNYLDENGNDANAHIQAAAESRVSYDEVLGRWVAEQAGDIAFIAIVGGVGDDLVHATVVEPAGVLISQRDASGHFTGSFGGVTIDVTIQSDIILRVAPADAQQAPLAGALGCEWTSDNPAVASITSDPTDNVITVHPAAAGTATLSVQIGMLSGQTTLTVGG